MSSLVSSFFLRERERTGERQRARESKNPKQAPCPVWSPMWGLIS